MYHTLLSLYISVDKLLIYFVLPKKTQNSQFGIPIFNLARDYIPTMTGVGNEMVLMLEGSPYDGEVITVFEDLQSNISSIYDNPLQPPSDDVDMSFDLTENNLADFVTLSPAEESSESFNPIAPDTSFLATSDHSPSVSSFYWSSPGTPSSVLYSPSSLSSVSEENTEVTVSPSEVLFGGQTTPKKKRGRKPKSANGSCNPTSSQTANVKRLRAYEVHVPYNDKEKEKRRVNAIKAKRHRDSQKKTMEELQQQVAHERSENDKLKMEKDKLEREVKALRLNDYDGERERQKMELENLRREVAELTRKCEYWERHWEAQKHQIMKLLQKTPEF